MADKFRIGENVRGGAGSLGDPDRQRKRKRQRRGGTSPPRKKLPDRIPHLTPEGSERLRRKINQAIFPGRKFPERKKKQ